jgi:hypothetical protein
MASHRSVLARLRAGRVPGGTRQARTWRRAAGAEGPTGGGRGARSGVDVLTPRPFGASRQAPLQLAYPGASVCRDFLVGSPRMVGGARPPRWLQERGRQLACSSRSFVSRCTADHCPVPRFRLIVWAARPDRHRRSAVSHGRILTRSPPADSAGSAGVGSVGTGRAAPRPLARGPTGRASAGHRNAAGASWARTRHAEPAVVHRHEVDLWAVVDLVGLARRKRPRAVRWGVDVGPNTTGTMVSASGSTISARCRPQCARSIRVRCPPAWIRCWPSDGAQTANGLASPRGASLGSCRAAGDSSDHR